MKNDLKSKICILKNVSRETFFLFCIDLIESVFSLNLIKSTLFEFVEKVLPEDMVDGFNWIYLNSNNCVRFFTFGY